MMSFVRVCGLFLFILAVPLAQAQPPEINLIEVLYSTGYDGRPHDQQGVFTYRHAKPWSIGDNFFFIDVSDVGNFEATGNTYIEWGPRLSLGKILSKAPWQFGLIRDVYLVGELNHVHNKHAIGTTTLEGLSFDLAIPGFQMFKLHLENRNDPDLPGHTGQITMIYNYPFRIGAQNFSVEGFLDMVGSEGSSSRSLHMQPQLLWHWTDKVYAGVEYQYWRNKLGREGFTESVMQAMVRYTF